MSRGTFATAINCMDGRVQEPIVSYLKEFLGVDYVDMVTDPGPDGILTKGTPSAIEYIKERVGISVNAHGSGTVAIVVHHDCAGFPVSKEEHLEAAKACVGVVEGWMFPVRILTLWVGETWEVELLYDSKA